MRKSLRYLRISWTVPCAIVCLLLVCLWVRSYGTIDGLAGIVANQRLSVHAAKGRVRMSVSGRADVSGYPPYQFVSFPATSGLSDETASSFHFHSMGNWKFVSVPIWSVLLCTAVFAAFPWLPLKRFSLRTLLIATTAVAVVLGMVVWSMR